MSQEGLSLARTARQFMITRGLGTLALAEPCPQPRLPFLITIDHLIFPEVAIPLASIFTIIKPATTLH